MPTRILLLLAVAAVEALPLALLAGLLAAWSLTPGAVPLPAAAVFAAVLLGYGATRLLVRRRVAERPARVLLVLAGLAVSAALYAVSSALSHGQGILRDPGLAIVELAVVLFAWSRGAVLAREDLVFDAIYSAFRRGLIVLFAVLVLALNTAGALARGLVRDGWGDVIVFFLAALCALSLARVEEERCRGAGVEGPPPVRGEWVLTLLGVTGGLLVLGLVLSSFLSPVAAALALAPLGRVADALQWLLTPLILLLGALLDPLVELLRSLLHRHAVHPPAQPQGKTRQPDLSHLLKPHASSADVIHGLLLVVAVIGVMIALWYAFAERRRSASDDAVDEERESLWSWSLLLAGLRRLWRRLWGRFVPPPEGELAAPTQGGGDHGALSIRAIYRRMLLLAAALGHPRHGAETPHEYLARLRGAVPASEKDAALLTALYARARYGPAAPDQADVAAAREVWTRLEPTLQRPEGDGPPGQ